MEIRVAEEIHNRYLSLIQIFPRLARLYPSQVSPKRQFVDPIPTVNPYHRIFNGSPDTRGKWRLESEEEMPATFGMNEKGEMDDAELGKYLFNWIVPLYPDAADIPGKRVIIKVDSRQSRKNIEMLAELRARGFYLYSGVPNTTSISQEVSSFCGFHVTN